MSSDQAIRIQGLSKSFPIYSKPHHRLLQMITPSSGKRWFREFPALRGIDFTVGRGETVGIVGRNGSGKSTLLQLICGTLSPSQGQVEVHGRVAALLELGAGFNPEFTGRENVLLNGTILGLSREQVANKFQEIAEFADIGDFMDQPVKSYSSGMYVRLAFAVAINVTPDILIIDEALSVGDEAFQRKCFSRIHAIRDAGATVLFVSHSAGTVVELCDRAILLDQGELIAEGTPKQVVARYQKLSYAPAHKMAQVREEIRSSLGDRTEIDAAQPAEPRSAAAAPADFEAYWEEGMVSASTVVYENRGADIRDPHLQTLDGRRVNVLVPGDEYVYAYQVCLEQPLVNVRCGMMIRTVTGFEIAGAVTAQPHDVHNAYEAGAVLHVRFRFRCLLTAGVYFLNAGLMAKFGDGEEFADRRVDVVMFRVQHVAHRLATALVDLDVVPHIRVSPE